MSDEFQKKVDKKPIANFVQSKKNRSILFLSLSVFVILVLNATLPVIEGNSHYTVEALEYTYGEYLQMKEQDERFTLTWGSKRDIKDYQEQYVIDNEMDPSEIKLVDIPPSFPVTVNTKFFFQYVFWYVSTAVSLGSSIILFYSLFNYLIIEARDKEQRYRDLVTEIEKMRDGMLDPVTFEPWMDYVFNYRRKIEQHKANVKYALDMLEQRTNYKVRYRLKPYFLEQDPVVRQTLLDDLGKLTKKERRYFDKRTQLLSLLDPVYIDNYINNGRVKHFKYIHPMFIYNGVNNLGKTIDSYSLIQSDAERMSHDAGRKVTLSLTTTVLFAVLFTVTAVASVGQSPLWIFINIASKVAPLMIQVPMAFKYSDDFMDNHVIKNLIERRSIGLLYLADMKKHIPIEDPVLVCERKLRDEQERNRRESMRAGNVKVVNNDA
jgi:hypothetical protein